MRGPDLSRVWMAPEGFCKVDSPGGKLAPPCPGKLEVP